MLSEKTVFSSYVVRADGPGCGINSLSDSDECATAAAAHGYRGQVQTGSWSWAPYGCFVGDEQYRNEWKHTYFNNQHGTTGAKIYKSICRSGKGVQFILLYSYSSPV